MYTLCPHCSTCFRLTTEHINVAQGNVRCGNCGAIFNALDNPAPEPDNRDDPALTETDSFLPEPFDYDDEIQRLQREVTNQSSDEEYELLGKPDFTPLGESTDHKDKSEDISTFQTTDESSAPQVPEIPVENLHEQFVHDVEDTTIEELERLFLPDESDGTKTALREMYSDPVQEPSTPDSPPSRLSFFSHHITLSIGSLLLITLLLGQYVYFARDHLAQRYAELRPLLVKMCNQLDCELALQRDLNKLQLTNRDVRTHPTSESALLINATFVNKAVFRQPYPLLELKLSNLRGKLIGTRLFQPGEYLAGNPDLHAGIAPDTQVYIVLELADPGKQAVNFEFDFR